MLKSKLQVLPNLEVRIGSHRYKCNWVISRCNYDCILELPWHKETRPTIDYVKGQVEVNGELLNGDFDTTLHPRIQNMSLKQLGRAVRRKNAKVQLFNVKIEKLDSDGNEWLKRSDTKKDCKGYQGTETQRSHGELRRHFHSKSTRRVTRVQRCGASYRVETGFGAEESSYV